MIEVTRRRVVMFKIPTDKGVVILDRNIYTTLLSYNLCNTRRRKYPFPIRLTGNYCQWIGFIKGKRMNILLHHMVIGKPLNGMHVDHINRNPLDNRKCNLRVVCPRDNHLNRRDNNKLPGAILNKSRGTYRSMIRINGEVVYLGTFKCELMASAAYTMCYELMKLNRSL